ncbi:peroxidase-like [Uloborus diversus]|uniref:peroxidase-like n=1 Tax=Uloborus diversus TaxID=327109 RepID=UPI00240A4A28|nr:peroxidase-like [Uloborus diversus]
MGLGGIPNQGKNRFNGRKTLEFPSSSDKGMIKILLTVIFQVEEEKFLPWAWPLFLVGVVASYDQPSPFSIDYSPECALVLKQSKGSPFKRSLDPGLSYISEFVPSWQNENIDQTCIRYEDINRALHEARRKFEEVPWEIKDLSSVYPKVNHISIPAEILLETVRILAHRFGLSTDAIAHGLPQIDTSKTAIKEICPTFLQPVKCEISRYRTLSGMCNNLDNPSWGSARSAMIRFIPPSYGDGISIPRRAFDGSPLPSPRVVSLVMHHDVSEHDYGICNMIAAWGQMLDHDLTRAAPTIDTRKRSIECCKTPVDRRHYNCYPVDIPQDDPFYKFFDRRCMNFARSLAGMQPGCRLGPRWQTNAISAYIDGNFIYGSNEEVASRLREFKGGRLKTSPLYRNLGLKDLLPMKTVDPDLGCIARPRNMYCFDAGDDRVNEQLQLAVMHIVIMREHNRLADGLYHVNPHWDDETLYQEARHILSAQLQHITYNEFLPMVLGHQTVKKYDLQPLTKGYYSGYSTKINAGIRAAFQSSAFRFGHSILPDVTERYNKFHERIEAIRLSRQLLQPYDLYKPGIVDTFILGLINQEAYRMDPSISTEVTNHLFEKPGDNFGMDLAAVNVQRAREHGLPGYNRYREYCGLPKVRDFYDLAGIIPNNTVHKYAKLYKTVDDIDLWSIGIAEYPIPGAIVGPTFACLIGEQFANIRRGDRFWYENHGWPSSFTPEQLQEIRKVRLARILCDNADEMLTVQYNAMAMADPHTNPRLDCGTDDIPRLDLSKWRDTNYKK